MRSLTRIPQAAKKPKNPLPWALQCHRASHIPHPTALRDPVSQIRSELSGVPRVNSDGSFPASCSPLHSYTFRSLPHRSYIPQVPVAFGLAGAQEPSTNLPNSLSWPASPFAWHDRALISTQCSGSEKAINIFPTFLVRPQAVWIPLENCS